MVSKEQRRRRLAREGEARRRERRAARQAHRRRIRRLVTVILVLAALVGLALWIVGHGDAGNTAGAARDYDAVSRHDIPNAIAEVTR
ncbi:MAG: hypothetical protein ACXVD1_11270 [Nocardioides sp.]